MMANSFQTSYQRLNKQQREAVDTIDGPVLVLAGPGTGKTELLAVRVANIIKQTDTAPSNILCLTFTDNAARNMRDRLGSIIGQPAYHVAIHTFHSFGSELINQYSDRFSERQLLQQVDELGRYGLLRAIFESLPHSNPLSTKVGDDFVHLKDTLNIIGWLKQNALSPSELRELLAANDTQMEQLADKLSEVFTVSPSPKLLSSYQELLATIQHVAQPAGLFGFADYATLCASELSAAIAAIPAAGRFAPTITAWRNRWCQKNAEGVHVFKDSGAHSRKLHAVAQVYQKINKQLAEQGLFDFDDMIMEAVHGLERDSELRMNAQERYQYILVDEFQDTNKAQLRMLQALGDNPVNEGRPNIMAVGDDDQAIYAFQGAAVSNMATFAQLYRQPVIITLRENYRSTAPILEASYTVAAQVSDRLETVIDVASKQLVAQQTAKTELAQLRFASELAQYDWVAHQIAERINGGARPESIAVIAPRHRYLERLMPYLARENLPVAYERREDILDSQVVLQLIAMATVVANIASHNHEQLDSSLAQVLSYEFWGIGNQDLMALSLRCYKEHRHWLAVCLGTPGAIATIANWFVDLARRSSTEPLEYILDALLGDISVDDTIATINSFKSPMYDHYFSAENYEQATDSYLTFLGHLSTLRQQLRAWKPQTTLYVHDLIVFVQLHRQAGIKIIDTNPHTQSTNAVQVMTAYKAKGLEFDSVYLINVQDEIWGPTTKSRSSSISLPKNLAGLSPAADTDNDRLRLLFVSMTRARNSLLLTSYTHTLENRLSPSLSYISDISALSAKEYDAPTSRQAIQTLSTDWTYRFRHILADKPTLFEPLLAEYALSVTHLNNFINIVDAGPQYFLTHNLLRFPAAPTPSAAYGDAIHKTLQHAHTRLQADKKLPSIQDIESYFDDILVRKHLAPTDQSRLLKRGRLALRAYFAMRSDRFMATDLVERNFKHEGVVIDGTRLSGKIDKMHFVTPQQLRVVDFKTGKPARSWNGSSEFEKIKLHKYRQQLLFYKLLVDNAASFSQKATVQSGALEFVEPENDNFVDDLELHYNPEELARFQQLLSAVWQHIMKLDFPDTQSYPKNLRGLLQFEQDLIDGTI